MRSECPTATTVNFGQCAGGDVVGYVFADEGHELSYNANRDPQELQHPVQLLPEASQAGR